jgi:hypothetical protein
MDLVVQLQISQYGFHIFPHAVFINFQDKNFHQKYTLLKYINCIVCWRNLYRLGHL